MAKKGRKKQYINQLRQPDKDMGKALSRCKYATKDMLHEIGISDKRILNYQRDGLMEKKVFYNKELKRDDCAYNLTKQGEKFFKNNLNIDYFYSSTSITHDLRLMDTYLSLNQSKQDNWITENEFREIKAEFLADLKENDTERYNEICEMNISVCDGGYYDVALEMVITIEIIGGYTKEQVEAKERFCEVMGYGRAW